MKKIIALVLSVLMLIGCLPISALALITGDPIPSSNISDDSEPISTADQFKAMTANGYYHLTGNINFNGEVFTSGYILEAFSGMLNGKGYSIYNFKISGGTGDCGIFKHIATENDTYINNLNVGTPEYPVEMTLTGTTAQQYGILSAEQGGDGAANHLLTFSNVNVYCNIEASVTSSSNINVDIGGLIGVSRKCNIYGCSVNGRITANSGANQKVRLHVGGLVGSAKSQAGNISNCINKASITANSVRLVARPAGIVSYVTNDLTLDSCINIGAITADGNLARAGGIIADAEAGTYTVNVKNCANFGTVTSNTVGGAANAEAAAVIGHYESGTVRVNTFAGFGSISSEGGKGLVAPVSSSSITESSCKDLSASPNHDTVGVDFGNMYTQTEHWNASIVACQYSTAVGGKLNARFVATVDMLDYETAGFEGVAFYKDGSTPKRWSFSKDCGTVYTSLLANDGVSEYSVTADELGGNYLLALSLKNIPASDDAVTILIRPYFTDSQAQKYYGNVFVAVTKSGSSEYVADFSKNPIESFRWSKPSSERATGADFRILSWNILSQELTSTATADVSRTSDIAFLIQALAPDAIGLQEISESAYASLETKLGSKYTFVNKTNSAGNYSYTGIMYNHENWECLHDGIEQINSGRNARIRLMNWIHIRNRTTEAEVVVMSLHWETKASLRTAGAEHTASRVKELATTYGCPVIVTGDFNAKEGSSAYETYIDQSGHTEPKYTSPKSWNIGFTGHNPGVCYPSQCVPSSIDHITTTADVTPLYYETIINEYVAPVSDHFPIYADLKIFD